MNTFYKNLCAVSLAASMLSGTLVPAAAVPLRAATSEIGQSEVIQIQSRRDWRRDQRRDRRREMRRDRRHDQRAYRFERRNGRAYFNGHRGYDRRRSGYRQYNGFWFPPAAFIAGAIIRGAIENGSQRGDAHVRYCYNRYRSYRASDDTFQPYNGPRRRCVSP